jgi:hypothetical protein
MNQASREDDEQKALDALGSSSINQPGHNSSYQNYNNYDNDNSMLPDINQGFD